MEPAVPAPDAALAPSSGRLKLRFAIFVVVVMLLLVGPIARQVLKLDTWLRGWQMFHGKATDICDVSFVVESADGTEARPSVETVIRTTGLENRDRSGSYYRLRKADDVRRAGRAYCASQKLSSVRATARCGHPERGWVRAMGGDEELCGAKVRRR
jgi:hypothetical protein